MAQTLAQQKIETRKTCNDAIEIQTDGSFLPSAHVWPVTDVGGTACQCGRYGLLRTAANMLHMTRLVRVR